jgi:G2/mitotic-specific cyclin 3/4
MPAHLALHQKAKVSTGLKTSIANGGLRLAPKRAAFVDVSNTVQAVADTRPLDPIKAPLQLSSNPQESTLHTVLECHRTGLHTQAHDENSRAIAVPIINPSKSNKVQVSTVADRFVAPSLRTINPQRATIVYNDSAPVTTITSTIPPQTEDHAVGANSQGLKKPRHYKSQPLIRKEQPTLRRTQSRLLSQTSNLIRREDVGLPVYVDALEQQLQNVDAAAYIQQQERHEELPRKVDDAISAPYHADAHGTALRVTKELAQGPILAETDEYWDDEDDEVYDDQGYTTAHSYRSHGDNTTGGVTTLVAPKVTAKVRKELEVARAIVEENRTPEEVEEEAWDVSMVAEYGDEIFDYMRELEVLSPFT